MLRLFLAVALPHHPAASTVGGIILPPIGIAKAARHRPFSGVQPLQQRSFPRSHLAKKWTLPPTIPTSRPPLHPPAPSSAFEMATPRTRRTMILPASVRPIPRTGQLPPVELDSPCPMSRTHSGLA